jgi:hypothetical protein
MAMIVMKSNWHQNQKTHTDPKSLAAFGPEDTERLFA